MSTTKQLLALAAVVAIGGLTTIEAANSAPTLNERREAIEAMESESPTPEQLERKDRSIAILNAEEVPYIENLPVIASEAQAEMRTEEEVELRALCLTIVAAKGEGIEQSLIDDLVADFGLEQHFTPDELAFINNEQPTQQERVNFSWRYESAWVMFWALGFLDELPRPDRIADVPALVDIVVDNTTESFQEEAQLRSASEILDSADLIYRYNWAATDARINNREMPAGLNASVIYERHYSLNWLMGYMGQEWDDVTTDT